MVIAACRIAGRICCSCEADLHNRCSGQASVCPAFSGPMDTHKKGKIVPGSGDMRRNVGSDGWWVGQASAPMTGSDSSPTLPESGV